MATKAEIVDAIPMPHVETVIKRYGNSAVGEPIKWRAEIIKHGWLDVPNAPNWKAWGKWHVARAFGFKTQRDARLWAANETLS